MQQSFIASNKIRAPLVSSSEDTVPSVSFQDQTSAESAVRWRLCTPVSVPPCLSTPQHAPLVFPDMSSMFFFTQQRSKFIPSQVHFWTCPGKPTIYFTQHYSDTVTPGLPLTAFKKIIIMQIVYVYRLLHLNRLFIWLHPVSGFGWHDRYITFNLRSLYYMLCFTILSMTRFYHFTFHLPYRPQRRTRDLNRQPANRLCVCERISSH